MVHFIIVVPLASQNSRNHYLASQLRASCVHSRPERSAKQLELNLVQNFKMGASDIPTQYAPSSPSKKVRRHGSGTGGLIKPAHHGLWLPDAGQVIGLRHMRL